MTFVYPTEANAAYEIEKARLELKESERLLELHEKELQRHIAEAKKLTRSITTANITAKVSTTINSTISSTAGAIKNTMTNMHASAIERKKDRAYARANHYLDVITKLEMTTKPTEENTTEENTTPEN